MSTMIVVGPEVATAQLVLLHLKKTGLPDVEPVTHITAPAVDSHCTHCVINWSWKENKVCVLAFPLLFSMAIGLL